MRPDSGRARGRRGTATQIMNSDISEVQDRLRERLISLTYERPARRTERSLTSLYPAAVPRRTRSDRGPLRAQVCADVRAGRWGCAACLSRLHVRSGPGLTRTSPWRTLRPLRERD